ncbi:MAG: ATP-binding protein [Vicinamibacterales bacterium]
MDGLLNAGSEVLRSQIIAIAGFAAILVWLALRMYRRMHADRDSLVVAERAALRATRTAELTAGLALARTPAAAIEASIQEPLHALGAECGVMFLMSSDGSRADVARCVGYTDGREPLGGPLTEHPALHDAVGRGAPILLEGPRASATIPLLIGSRVVALARLEYKGPRSFTADDREYLETLGVRAAQALDRTWQFEYALKARAEAETQRARADQEITEREKIETALRASEARGRALAARTSRLHALTAALSESVTLDAVAHAVVHQGRVAVGAIAAEVALLVDDETAFETISAEGAGFESHRRVPVERGLCGTDAVEKKEAVFVSSFEEWQERYPTSASLAADGGYVSSATLPLLTAGRATGVLAFFFTMPVSYDEEYRALLVSVAQHCAQALDRARLYESAQKARADAESANRLKDEFVSIVSHELRSPLNAILGWSAMLLRGTMEPSMTARAVQAVNDNATRQSRLIEELLDFSRVSSGRLALVCEEIPLRDLIRGVVESMIPETADKGVTLQLLEMPPLRVDGDLQRLEQVLFNLLGNALKFTARGGRVTVAVERHDGMADIRVTDTGRGIDPDFLPFVFDRFRQGDPNSREQGGLGLGLSIARQLVEAHDGSIRVESAGLGQGATFIVTLPVLSTPTDSSRHSPDTAREAALELSAGSSRTSKGGAP